MEVNVISVWKQSVQKKKNVVPGMPKEVRKWYHTMSNFLSYSNHQNHLYTDVKEVNMGWTCGLEGQIQIMGVTYWSSCLEDWDHHRMIIRCIWREIIARMGDGWNWFTVITNNIQLFNSMIRSVLDGITVLIILLSWFMSSSNREYKHF